MQTWGNKFMGLSSKLFFENNENETLFTRISLTPEQLEDARAKKDKLLELIKPELSSSLEVPVKHWLQGSYKNHTLNVSLYEDIFNLHFTFNS
jgi:hypothetical protein